MAGSDPNKPTTITRTGSQVVPAFDSAIVQLSIADKNSGAAAGHVLVSIQVPVDGGPYKQLPLVDVDVEMPGTLAAVKAFVKQAYGLSVDKAVAAGGV